MKLLYNPCRGSTTCIKLFSKLSENKYGTLIVGLLLHLNLRRFMQSY